MRLEILSGIGASVLFRAKSHRTIVAASAVSIDAVRIAIALASVQARCVAPSGGSPASVNDRVSFSTTRAQSLSDAHSPVAAPSRPASERIDSTRLVTLAPLLISRLTTCWRSTCATYATATDKPRRLTRFVTSLSAVSALVRSAVWSFFRAVVVWPLLPLPRLQRFGGGSSPCMGRFFPTAYSHAS